MGDIARPPTDVSRSQRLRPRRVLHHHHRIRARRQRSPRHNRNRLATLYRALLRRITRPDLPNHLQPRRNRPYILRPHRVSIPRRPIKRRKVTIRQNGFGQHASTPSQQFYRFYGSSRDHGLKHQGRALLNNMPRLFEADNANRRHAETIPADQPEAAIQRRTKN